MLGAEDRVGGDAGRVVVGQPGQQARADDGGEDREAPPRWHQRDVVVEREEVDDPLDRQRDRDRRHLSRCGPAGQQVVRLEAADGPPVLVDDEHRGQPFELREVRGDPVSDGLDRFTDGGGTDLGVHEPTGGVGRMGEQAPQRRRPLRHHVVQQPFHGVGWQTTQHSSGVIDRYACHHR